MTNKQAIVILLKLEKRLNASKLAVRRKRSWRASEQAMAMAAYQEQIEAVALAIQTLGTQA